MAGEVKADQFRPPYRGRVEIMPRVCPATDRFGEVCVRLDDHTGQIGVCPFLYGLAVVVDEKHHVEGRSLQEIRAMIHSAWNAATWKYTVLCLQAPEAHTVPGIHPL